MRTGHPITPDELEQFLHHLREMPNITRAARLICASRAAVYDIKTRNPEFSTAWDEAIEEGIDNAEAMVHYRAFQGLDKVLTHRGQITYQLDYAAINPETEQPYLPHLAPLLRDGSGQLVPVTVKEYSDQLAIFLLKAHRPDKYRERSDVNITGQIDIANAIHAARKRSGG